MTIDVVVTASGEVRMIYSDEMASAIEALGFATIARASHVEPCGTGWTADMTPVGGPILGPFKLRGEALSAEVDWLRDHSIPGPVVS